MTEAKKRLPEEDRLYPTVKEERQYRELKEKYGFKDAVANKSLADKDDDAGRLRRAITQ